MALVGRDKLGVGDEQIIVIVAVVELLSHDQLFATPWTVACQAPLCMGFPRQEYWSELPCPTPGDLPDPGIEPVISCTGRQIPYHCTAWEAWINR